MAWEIVFEPSERPGQQDSCICFTKFETSMQVKKFIENGVAIHEIRKDGTAVLVSLAVSPIKDAAGRIIGASKTARDITERKRIE